MSMANSGGVTMAGVSGRGLAAWQVRRVMSHMSNRLEEGISLAEASAAVGLSPAYFCTAFRLATGRTPFAVFSALRIERARQLLTDPRVSITDISLTVGFQTPSAFANTFRRITGMTPSQFRKFQAVDPSLRAAVYTAGASLREQRAAL
ncbi:MAG TPA: AraC family transcriptional regulator [Steroidobacter sp.]